MGATTSKNKTSGAQYRVYKEKPFEACKQETMRYSSVLSRRYEAPFFVGSPRHPIAEFGDVFLECGDGGDDENTTRDICIKGHKNERAIQQIIEEIARRPSLRELHPQLKEPCQCDLQQQFSVEDPRPYNNEWIKVQGDLPVQITALETVMDPDRVLPRHYISAKATNDDSDFIVLRTKYPVRYAKINDHTHVYGGKTSLPFGLIAPRITKDDPGEDFRVIIGLTNLPIPEKATVGTYPGSMSWDPYHKHLFEGDLLSHRKDRRTGHIDFNWTIGDVQTSKSIMKWPQSTEHLLSADEDIYLVLEVRGGVDLYAFFDSALMYCEVEEFEGNSDGYKRLQKTQWNGGNEYIT